MPRATCRLQLWRDFTFDDGATLAPYLAALGVSHVYASPILAARAGSIHGYDVVDPGAVNPELGGEAALRRLVEALRCQGLGLIVDIVPNHVAVGGADNAWWLDVLENGAASAHAGFFDIDWRPADPALHGKVLAPFLGSPYGEALAAGEIRLVLDEALGRLAAAHHHHRFPIRPQDYAPVLRSLGEAQLAALADRFAAAAPEGGVDEAAFAAARADLMRLAGDARAALERAVAAASQPDALHALLERQNHRLAWWRTAGDDINWRRFFEITELAGLRIERPEVFEAVHATIFRLYGEGLIDGVRVDHVDGLADPGAYCRALRTRLGELAARRPAAAPAGPAMIVVEKILAPGERLPPDWPVDGTTGYDFMNLVAGLLHDPAGEAPLTRLWTGISGRPADFEVEERTARREILLRSFAGQLDAAAAAFHRLARASLATRDVSFAALRRALIALIGVFPAYRIYPPGADGLGSHAAVLARAVAEARRIAARGEEGVIDLIAAWLGSAEGADPDLHRDAIVRFQQLSAPIAAKAVEDTAFYRYGRLLSRNDVGFDPGRLAIPAKIFHAACAERARESPGTLLATATHDHKRGEDVRARLAVLSEVPDLWAERVRAWFALNAPLRPDGVDPGDEYQLYQMIVGAWPPALRPDDAEGLSAYAERLAGWQQKALREAKLRSAWTEPDAAYEAACRALLDGLLDPRRSAAFLASMGDFVRGIGPAGALNGLVQAFLRCVVPGIPDLYRGTEFWDFSLVDPDNRRPVDFAARERALAQAPGFEPLMVTWADGRLKQAVIASLLAARRREPDLFAAGDHAPLEIRGPRSGHVVAFARRHGAKVLLAAACRFAAGAVWEAERPLPEAGWWAGTVVVTPPDLVDIELEDAFRPGRRAAAGREVPAKVLFELLPVSLRLSGGDGAG